MAKKRTEYVVYQGRKVEKQNFRVFVYNREGQKLVNSYDEYLQEIKSGKWFEAKSAIPIVAASKKAKANDANSERIC